jgi:hypothetical protein
MEVTKCNTYVLMSALSSLSSESVGSRAYPQRFDSICNSTASLHLTTAGSRLFLGIACRKCRVSRPEDGVGKPGSQCDL